MINYRFFLIAILLVSCNTKKFEYGNAKLSSNFKITKIKSLENNLMEFDNDTIRIYGDLHLDLENKCLCNNSIRIWINSFKPSAVIDSVWKNMNGSKVEITGLYKAGKTGHLGLYDGKFEEVYFIKTD